MADQPSSILSLPFVKGERIIIRDIGTFYASVDEPYYVLHGWLMEDWTEASPEDKMNHQQCWFELEIDGVSVPLKQRFFLFKTFEHPAGILLYNAMLNSFSINFEANSFTAGTYTFRGTSYLYDGTAVLITEREVIFEN
jgi:hypothetical protein